MSKLQKLFDTAPVGVKFPASEGDVKEFILEILEASIPNMPNDFHDIHATKDAMVLATEMGLAYNQGVSDLHSNMQERLTQLKEKL